MANVAVTRVGRRFDIPLDTDVMVWTFDTNVTSVSTGNAFVVDGVESDTTTVAGPGAKEITGLYVPISETRLHDYAVINANGTNIVFAGGKTILDQAGVINIATCSRVEQRPGFDLDLVVWVWDKTLSAMTYGDIFTVNCDQGNNLAFDAMVLGPGVNEFTAAYFSAEVFTTWEVKTGSDPTDIAFTDKSSIYTHRGSVNRVQKVVGGGVLP